jgi:hypothetical protein
MKRLKNNAGRAVGLPTARATRIPQGGSVDVSDADMELIKANKTCAIWLERGVLTVDGEDPKAGKEAATEKAEDKEEKPEELPDGVTGEDVEVICAGGWCQVYVNGIDVIGKKVRKEEAQKVAAEYEA